MRVKRRTFNRGAKNHGGQIPDFSRRGYTAAKSLCEITNLIVNGKKIST